MIRVLTTWLPIAFVVTVLCFLVVGVVQQNLRQGANDPQIQVAEDAAAALAAGRDPRSVLPPGPVDVGRSLASFVIVFDDSGHPRASSALLHDQIPTPPSGVFAEAKASGEDRITWQPEAGVREAAVIVPIAGGNQGYVLVGRSLREVEKREDDLNLEVVAAWILATGGSLVAVAVGSLWAEATKG